MWIEKSEWLQYNEMRKLTIQQEKHMKIYLAPLEGITGYTYRRALYRCFGGFDKYFIPFILPNQ